MLLLKELNPAEAEVVTREKTTPLQEITIEEFNKTKKDYEKPDQLVGFFSFLRTITFDLFKNE